MHEDSFENTILLSKQQIKYIFQGDVTFKYGSEFNSLMSTQWPQKLIIGNHDRIKRELIC